MTLWNEMARRMRRFAALPALSDGTTYEELLREAEARAEKFAGLRAAVISDEVSRREQALDILGALAAGCAAVPVAREYGEAQEAAVRKEVGSGKDLRGIALVIFTSGTTGRPKGVMLTHRSVWENIRGILGYFRVRPGERMLLARPLVHSAALVGELLFGLCAGLELDFYEEGFMPRRLRRALDARETDIFCCTPTILGHLARVPAEELRYPRVFSVSGERLQPRLAERAREAFPDAEFYNAYGLTENAPRVCALPPELFFEKPGAVGYPIRRTRLKLVGGELWVKSPSVMRGYLHDRPGTARKLCRGWLRTGDRAERDGDGCYTVLGRLDGTIIRAGVNLDASEIESAILECPGVTACRVYGADAEGFGQIVCAQVAGGPNLEDWKRCLGEMPAHLRPTRVEFVEQIETTASGKVKR